MCEDGLPTIAPGKVNADAALCPVGSDVSDCGLRPCADVTAGRRLYEETPPPPPPSPRQHFDCADFDSRTLHDKSSCNIEDDADFDSARTTCNSRYTEIQILDDYGNVIEEGLSFYLPCFMSTETNTLYNGIEIDEHVHNCSHVSAQPLYSMILSDEDNVGESSEELRFNHSDTVSWTRNIDNKDVVIHALPGAITAVRTTSNAPYHY